MRGFPWRQAGKLTRRVVLAHGRGIGIARVPSLPTLNPVCAEFHQQCGSLVGCTVRPLIAASMKREVLSHYTDSLRRKKGKIFRPVAREYVYAYVPNIMRHGIIHAFMNRDIRAAPRKNWKYLKITHM